MIKLTLAIIAFGALAGCTQKLTTSGILNGNASNGSSYVGGPVASTPTPTPTVAPTAQPTPNPTVTPVPSGNALNLTFTVNAQASRNPISPYIYGMNAPDYTHNIKLMRIGGNRWTAYNWTTNASNAGSDYLYENDNYLTSSTSPGAAVTTSVTTAQSNNAASIVTVPIVDYVAGDESGPVSSSQYAPTTPNTSTSRFASNILAKGSAFTLSPSSATDSGGHTYVDEFINFIENKYPRAHSSSSQNIFYMLDNEPGIWNSTHPEVHSSQTTYSEMATRTVNASKAIKNVAPNALIFGGVCYGYAEFMNLQSAPDAGQHAPFANDYLSFLLNTWSSAGSTAGKRLVDVLDVHWYNSGTNPVQDTRSLWDPSYVENSWITQDVLNNTGIQLIPWIMAKIAAQYPGTKLSISEYNYGNPTSIAGAISQADALGIFGRYGLFAAAEWPLVSSEPYIYAAYDMFQKYDGTNSVGDTSIAASTPDNVNSSVYGIASATDTSTIYVVVINKNSSEAINATINLTDIVTHSVGKAYVLKSGTAASVAGGNVTSLGNNSFSYQMPPYSVSTLVIK